MRIQVLSDLHFESHPDGGCSFIEALDPTGVGVLVLAGDVSAWSRLSDTLTRFCSKYREVVYVIGNHELYGAGFGTVRSILRKTSDGLANLHVLDNRSVTLGNRRFVGTTLWFPFQDDNILYEYRLNDFHLIENFGSLVYGENQRAVRYLSKTVQFGDIVVTHHLPTEESTPEQFVGGQINRFFICPLDDLIRDRRPAVWIHGHSHTSCRYRLWASWICCNPYGYFGAGANPEFESDLVIELSDEPDGSLCCK